MCRSKPGPTGPLECTRTCRSRSKLLQINGILQIGTKGTGAALHSVSIDVAALLPRRSRWNISGPLVPFVLPIEKTKKNRGLTSGLTRRETETGPRRGGCWLIWVIRTARQPLSSAPQKGGSSDPVIALYPVGTQKAQSVQRLRHPQLSLRRRFRRAEAGK